MVAVRAVHLIPFLVLLPARVALAGEVTPAMVWTGTAPSGSCVGSRVAVVVTTGKPYCCSSGTWAACGVSLPTCTGTDKLTSDGSTLSCATDSTSAGSGLPALVTSGDGAHLDFTQEASAPAAPASGSVRLSARRVLSGVAAVPGVMVGVDGVSGLSVPLDLRSGWLGTPAAQCFTPPAHGLISVGSIAWSTPAWSSSSAVGRIPRVRASVGSGANGALAAPAFGAWRGNSSGAGGFAFWAEWNLADSGANQDLFVGLSNDAGSYGTTTTLDTVWAGCNNHDNLQICSNDNSGSATCTDLGANYPCATGAVLNAVYRVAFWATPNSGSIGYAIERLDTGPYQTSGTISTDLPRNTVQLFPLFSIFDDATVDLLGMCLVANP